MKKQISLLENSSYNFMECFNELIYSIHKTYFDSEEGKRMLDLYLMVHKLVKKVFRKLESLQKDNTIDNLEEPSE